MLLVRTLMPFSVQAASVVVITPHAEGIRYEFARGFSEWHQKNFGEPAKVEWRDLGGSSDAIKFVQSEFASKPEGIGIDCFFGGGPEPFLLFNELGYSARCPLPAEVRTGLAPNLNGMELADPTGRWYGAVLSSFGILQNTLVQRRMGLPFAERWSDLANPKLVGWVGAGDPRNSGTMNNMYEAFFQAKGWEEGWSLLTRIAGNVRKFDRFSSSTAKEATSGEVAYSFAIDFYGFSQIALAGRSNMTMALPQDFTAVSPDGICLLKGAPNAATGSRFIAFVMSEAGQKLWFLPKGHPEGPQRFSIERMTVRPDFYKRYKGVSNIEFSPFDLQQPFRYDAKIAKARRDLIAGMVGAMLVDTHSELLGAWEAVIALGSRPEDIRALGAVPITEKEALELAAGDFKDAAKRNRLKIQWQTWAQAKYKRLRNAN